VVSINGFPALTKSYGRVKLLMLNESVGLPAAQLHVFTASLRGAWETNLDLTETERENSRNSEKDGIIQNTSLSDRRSQMRVWYRNYWSRVYRHHFIDVICIVAPLRCSLFQFSKWLVVVYWEPNIFSLDAGFHYRGSCIFFRRWFQTAVWTRIPSNCLIPKSVLIRLAV